ncbi:MAG: hypothetical protein AAF720_04695 [Pseudomonadota bacterium]
MAEEAAPSTANSEELANLDESQARSDSQENQLTYETFMRAYSEIGVPFAIALTVFFTNLVMANGVMVALIAAAATYLFVYFIVKAFFSH